MELPFLRIDMHDEALIRAMLEPVVSFHTWPTSKREALSRGMTHYLNADRPCRSYHNAPRDARTGRCVECEHVSGSSPAIYLPPMSIPGELVEPIKAYADYLERKRYGLPIWE